LFSARIRYVEAEYRPALASRDVGYMVAEMNVRLFSAHEVEAFENAVARHLRESGQAG